MSSAEAPSAAVRTMMPPFLRSSALTISRRRARSSSGRRLETPSPSPLGTKTTKRPGQRDVCRQAGALRLHRVLDRLDEDLLAALDQLLDLAALAATFELGDDDLVDVEEAVLLEPDLDEGGFHPGENVVDDALVDVAGDRVAIGALQIDLGDLLVLEHGDAALAGVYRDEKLALGGRQRHSAWWLRRRLPRSWRCDARRSAACDAVQRSRALAVRLGLLLLGAGLAGRTGLLASATAATSSVTPRTLRSRLRGRRTFKWFEGASAGGAETSFFSGALPCCV